jgi:hypothetical protein
VGWTAPGGKWALTLFGKNLTDEIGIVELHTGSSNDPYLALLTYPRQVGVQLFWRPFN